MTDLDELKTVSRQSIADFRANKVFGALECGHWTVENYHDLLLTLFYQVYQGTMSFAGAASNCPPRLAALREYLVHHANEEMMHYTWILDDLRSSGYQGPDPRSMLPPPATLAYVAFNQSNAQHWPGTRLASSIVLEGIGQEYGAWFGQRALAATGLPRDCFSFFFSHGETDKEHTVELWDILGQIDLTPDEWRWMKHASFVAGTFYRGMWDSSFASPPSNSDHTGCCRPI